MALAHADKESLLQRVEESLNGIRPFLHADGGDVKVLDIDEDMIVHLQLLGSCSDCQMSEMTMKAGIEQSIKNALPQIKKVIAIQADAQRSRPN